MGVPTKQACHHHRFQSHFLLLHTSSIMASTNGGTATTAPTSRYVPLTYTIPIEQPVVALDARTAFEKLTEREQLYAHYLSRASFYGGLICLLQTSPESPGIFRLIHKMNVA